MASFTRFPSLDSLASVRVGGDLNTCAICFEEYRTPKVLPCLHTFCYDCIRRHYETYKLRTREKLSCPSCRVMIPLPPGGVMGLKNDTVSVQIKGLLRRLPLDKNKVKEEGDSGVVANGNSDKEPLLGACGGGTDTAPTAVSSQIDELKMYENALQDVLVKLRSKALHMYTYERHVRVTMEKKNERESEDPSLRRLMTEQDRLYHKISDVRSLHDVIEDVLQKGSTNQVTACYSLLSSCAKETLTRMDKDTTIGGAGAAAGPVNPWLTEFQEVMFDIGAVGVSNPESGAISKKRVASPQLSDGQLKKSSPQGPTLVFKIGGFGSEPGKFDFPTHATFMPTGDILVSDKNNSRLQVFNEKGQLKREFLSGWVKPRRARVNPLNGLLYVSDEHEQCVKVFTPKGEVVRSIGKKELQCPSGLDFDKQGNVVVTDSEKNYLCIYTPEGDSILVTSFRVPFEMGRQPDPCFVAVNDDNQLVVSDMRNGRVKLLSNTGQQLFKISELQCPRGVCLDIYGNILVAESDRHQVCLFSPHGKFLKVLLKKEHGLRYPMSLDMNKTKELLMVTQCGFFSPHEVLVFKIVE